MQTPNVAIIIPIYNVQSYLRECLDSVINQTYQHLQIILVNDGSTDKSLEIAKEYFFKDQRIALISKPNAGLSDTRNVGLDYISEKYNAILSSKIQSSLQGITFINTPPPMKN